MPPGFQHHAKVICALCGRFIRWIEKPETIERRTRNAYTLARLGMCDGLSDWERAFVASISKCRTLSPKQQAVVDRLAAQYLSNGGKRPNK
jgi:hypothetical protein